MFARASLIALVALFLHVGCATAQAPQALQDLVQAEWETESKSLTLWTTADQDSAYVVGATQTNFRAHLSNGETWVHCPDTTPVVNGEPFPLSAIADSAEVMLREQSDYGMNGATLLLAECATTIAAMEDSVRSSE